MRALQDQGYKEVTLLGQNVNSYWDKSAQVATHASINGYACVHKCGIAADIKLGVCGYAHSGNCRTLVSVDAYWNITVVTVAHW